MDTALPTDPLNQTPYGSSYGTWYAILGKPSSRIMDSSGLALTTQYRYDFASSNPLLPTFSKLIQETDPSGKVTRYTLDANANRTAAIDAYGTPLQAQSTFTYNAQGFMTSMTDPDGRVTRYVPNPVRQPGIYDRPGPAVRKPHAPLDHEPLPLGQPAGWGDRDTARRGCHGRDSAKL